MLHSQPAGVSPDTMYPMPNLGGGQPQQAIGGRITVIAPDGSSHMFPDQASADRFKQLAGIK